MAEPLKDVHIHRHGNFGGGFTPDLKRCRASVHEGGRGVSFYQCAKKVAVERECTVYGEAAKGVQIIGFCNIHDPIKVAEKRAARDAKYAEETRQRELRDARLYERPKDYLAALLLIAEGHNDPHVIAKTALEKWDDAATSTHRMGD